MKRMLVLFVTLSLVSSSVFAGPARSAARAIRQSIAANDTAAFEAAVKGHSKWLDKRTLGILFLEALQNSSLQVKAVDLLENEGFQDMTDISSATLAEYKPTPPSPPTEEDLAKAIIVKLVTAAKGFNFADVVTELGNLKGNAWDEADKKAALKVALEDASVDLDAIAADVITKKNLELAIGVIDALEWAGMDPGKNAETFVGHVVTKAEAEYTPKFDAGVSTSVDDTAIMKTATLANFTDKAGGVVDVTDLIAMGAHTGVYVFTTSEEAERDKVLGDIEAALTSKDFANAKTRFEVLKAGTDMTDEADRKGKLKAQLPSSLAAITGKVTGASKDHIALAVLYADMVQWSDAFDLNEMLTDLLEALRLGTYYQKWKKASPADEQAIIDHVKSTGAGSSSLAALLDVSKMFLEKDFEALSKLSTFNGLTASDNWGDAEDTRRMWEAWTDKSVFLSIFDKKSDVNGSVRHSIVNQVDARGGLDWIYFFMMLGVSSTDFEQIIDDDPGFEKVGQGYLKRQFEMQSQESEVDDTLLESFAKLYKAGTHESIFKNVLKESKDTTGSILHSLRAALDKVKGKTYLDLVNVYVDLAIFSKVDLGNKNSGIMSSYVDALLGTTDRKTELKKATKIAYQTFIDRLVDDLEFVKDASPLGSDGNELGRLDRNYEADAVTAFRDYGWASKLYDSVFGSKSKKVAFSKHHGSKKAPLRWYQRLLGIRSRQVVLNNR